MKAPADINVSMMSNVSIKSNRNYMVCIQSLNKIFDKVQSDEYENGSKKQQEKFKNSLLNNVLKLSKEVGIGVLAQTLMRAMIIPFQTKGKNPYVTRLIDFFYAIISWDRFLEMADFPPNDETLTSQNESFRSVMSGSLLVDDDPASDHLPLLILKQCEKYHGESRNVIRLRLMQTVEKIIPEVISVSQLKPNFRRRLMKMFMIRSKDKFDPVRVLAVKMLAIFYSDDCIHPQFERAIADVILDRMTFDPSAEVRVAAVSMIKVSDDTFEHIVERAGDPIPNVRTAALNRIKNDIGLSMLTLEMREAILKFNSSDENPKSVQKAMSNLLQKWLESLNEDTTEFLRVLNVRRRSKLCRKALDILFNQPPEEAFEKISGCILKDNKKYPEESLCIEMTYLWLYMYERFKNEPYVFGKLALSVNEMIDYVKEFVDVIEEEGNLSVDDLSYRCWMLGDLLQILCFLPSEEGGRRAILEFLPILFSKKKLMDVRNSALAVRLISVCSDIHDETNLIDLVNSILDSDRRPRITHSKLKAEIPFEDEAEQLQSLKVQMGNLVHKNMKLERDRDFAVKESDMYKAQSCQDEIVKLEEEISKIKKLIDYHNNDQDAMNTSMNSTMNSCLSQDQEEPWCFSDKTLLITISMVKTNILQLANISNFSRTFYEFYVTKAVTISTDPVVRAQALELMCVVSLDNESECAKTASYCLVALMSDRDVVKVSALKCLYDLVARYSFAKLGQYPEVLSVLMGHIKGKAETPIGSELDNPTTLLKNFLLSYINDPNTRLTKISVEGVLKLLFRRELARSSKLIVSFLMKWAIPTHETKVRFKEVELMIPLYASNGEEEAIEVATCLITSIRKSIIEIRSHGESADEIPYPEIDKIVNLVVKATDPARLADFQRPYIGHETIANGALKELRKTELSSEERSHYAKLLKVLDLRLCPSVSVTRMKDFVNEIFEYGSKSVSTIMTGFSKYLDSLLEGVDAGAERMDEDVDSTAPGAFDDDE